MIPRDVEARIRAKYSEADANLIVSQWYRFYDTRWSTESWSSIMRTADRVLTLAQDSK